MKIAAVVLLFSIAAVSPAVRYFRYERPVSVAQGGGQTCMTIDPAIFAHAEPELADLRVYQEGIETPYVIQLAKPIKEVEKSIAPLNLGDRHGLTVFDAEMPEAHYREVELAISARDFIATVTVEGSQTEDGSAETRIGSYTVFDLTGQKLGRSTALHLPESDFRFLHFTIAGPLKPESVTGISVEHLPAILPKFETVAASSDGVHQGRSTVFEFMVPAHVPVDRVTLVPGAMPALFNRDVSIAVAAAQVNKSSDESEPARPNVYSGNVLRVHKIEEGHTIDEERLSIDVPSTPLESAAKWTVMIDNGDDAPLIPETVRLEMVERRLCFEAVANRQYTVFYGDSALTAPRYDYATMFVAQSDPTAVTAGAERGNAAYQPRPDDRPFTEKHPALLWAALIAVVMVLGGIALQSARRSSGAANPQG
jgi:hypothetical protein